MTVTNTRFNDWNFGFFFNRLNETGSATRDEQVYILSRRHKFFCYLMRGIFNQLNGICCDTRIFQSLTGYCNQGLVGIDGITSSSENDGIISLKGKAKGID